MTSRGRDPRFLRARVPRQARRAAGPIRDAVVPAPTGPAPITCSARSSAAPTTRDMVGSVVVMPAPDYQNWLEQNGAGDDPGASRARRCSCATAAAAAMAERRRRTNRQHGARAVAGRPLRQPGAAVRRQHGHRRRPLHPRFDPDTRSSRWSPAIDPSCRPSPDMIGEDDC